MTENATMHEGVLLSIDSMKEFPLEQYQPDVADHFWIYIDLECTMSDSGEWSNLFEMSVCAKLAEE